MKYVAFTCFYITMNVICYGGYSMSTILFYIFIDFIFFIPVYNLLFAPAGSNKKEGLPQSLFY